MEQHVFIAKISTIYLIYSFKILDVSSLGIYWIFILYIYIYYYNFFLQVNFRVPVIEENFPK